MTNMLTFFYQVIHLVSNTFNYSTIDRAKSRTKKNLCERFPNVGKRFNRIGLPAKVGSLQMYAQNYEDASVVLKRFEDEPLSEDLQKEFQLQFERLVCLDYIIRNTDRNHDNWLIKFCKPEDKDDQGLIWSPVKQQRIKIAAIDNGLAFPFKHPDEWRACKSFFLLVTLIYHLIINCDLFFKSRSLLLGMVTLC